MWLISVMVLMRLTAAAAAPRAWSPPAQYRIATRTVPGHANSDFFTQAIGLNFDNAVLLNGTNSSAAETDDTPLDLVGLPFPFFFYGERKLHVWINPNGAIQFDSKPPCHCCFSANNCDFNSSY